MIKTVVIGGLAAAALIGGGLLFVAPSTEVKASTPSAKSDRFDIQRSGGECSQHAWPYYPSDCIRDYRRSAGKASEVRLVFAGHLPSAATHTPK
jgi:hypothetical protein